MYTPIRVYSSAIALSASIIVLFLMGCEEISNIIDPPDDDNGQELHRLLVPEDYPTIQAAIDAAIDGDTVLVYPGTYVDTVSFKGKNIVVGSRFLTTGDTSYIRQTIIDADWNGSVVSFTSLEDSTAELCGFTLTHGSGTPVMRGSGGPGFCGGGIFIAGSGPYLHHLRIINNEVSFRGGGIFIKTQRPLKIHDMLFANNRAENIGGGVCVETRLHPPYPVFSNLVIASCEAYSGGGLSLISGSTLIADRMEISGNTAEIGGGLNIDHSHLVGTQVVIAQNIGNWAGGGAHIYNGTLELTDGTITGNSTGGNGGGCAVETYGRVYLTNTDVSQNLANSNGGGLSHTTLNYPGTGNTWLTVENSTFTDNHALGGSGGAIYSRTLDLKFSKAILSHNTAANDGGAIFSEGILTAENTLIVDNSAGLWGGGFVVRDDAVFTNVTIASNQAWVGGSGVIQASEDFLAVELTNTISWDNDPPEIFLNQLGHYVGITVRVNYCDIENGQQGNGNLAEDPEFADPSSGDYQLSASSPCIDAGDPAPEFNDPDGSRNDMGAYGGPHPLAE
jgi:predicted outer membrane repeat protein